MHVTASKLYDFLQCQHRVWRDIYGPKEEMNPEPNAFVQLLWERGVSHEKDVIKELGSILDLSHPNKDIQFENTMKAMRDGVPLIYHGYIKWQNLAGEPDLLKKNSDGTYMPIDIKSGRGFENVESNGEEKEKYKKHYALQLCLYAEILHALGFGEDNVGFIFDIDNKEVLYQLDEQIGSKTHQTWKEAYQETKNEVALLMENQRQNTPALSGVCKLCPWYESCKKWCKDNHDLSLIFFLGRSKRAKLIEDIGIERGEELITLDIPAVLEKKAKDKHYLHNIGESTLQTMKRRASILFQTTKPAIYKQLTFPSVKHELFFDIEDDPTQGFVYLHGVYERINGTKEIFHPFTAKDFSKESEKSAWQEFVSFVHSLPKDDWCLYYYSKHEPTTYKKMREQYPDVITEEELEYMFDPSRAVDLYYDVILKYTDWPLYSYSLKEIARYLKFDWRDKTPSGALSIQWFNEYLETKDPKKLERIILYNEDDCKATMVIKDFLTSQPSTA